MTRNARLGSTLFTFATPFLFLFLLALGVGCTEFRSGPKDSHAGGAGGRNQAGNLGGGGKGGGAGGGKGGVAMGGGAGSAGSGHTGGNGAGNGGGMGGGDGGLATGGAAAGGSGGVCGSPTDPKNCGTCGHDCTALTNVSPTAAGVECRAGTCFIPAAACAAGTGHCSSRADDGCEADLANASHCGACGTTCSGAASICSASAAGLKCASACGTSAPDLCGASSCVDLKTDKKNCGTCGHDCTALSNVMPGAADVECRAGACYVPASACVKGYGHCSSRADDGCETSFTTSSNCGSCTKTCSSPTGLCSTTTSPATCTSSCAAPSPDLCTNKCVNRSNDPYNCGACNHDCTQLPGVKSTATGIECRSGACYVPASACNPGRAHCSSNPDDGCEADLTSPATCGSCGLACNGGTPLCSTQTTPAKCLPSCGGTSPDICGTKCVNKANDVKNCGVCDHDCGGLAHVKPGATSPAVQCVSGACVIQSAGCVSGYGHCSTKPDDGCETDLTRPATCGSCSNPCMAPTGLCSTTGAVPACSSSCTTPNPDLCGSACVDMKTDPAHCGSCSHNCTTLNHLKSNPNVSCSSTGGCVVPTSACAPGFANCAASSNDTDGCETATNTNTNCGGCGVTCGGTNATGDCSSGTCHLTCNPDYWSCNGSCISTSAPCAGACMPGSTLCGGACLASTGCCAPTPAATHYVDTINGTDAPDHGGTGSCAYKTIGYALGGGRATGTIAVLATGTYTSEGFPLVLTGSQQLACNPTGSGRATIQVVSYPGVVSLVELRGTHNVVTDCIINGGVNGVVGVSVYGSGLSNAQPNALTNVDIGDCNSADIIVQANVGNVKIQNCTLHGSNHGIVWQAGSSGQMLTNQFTVGLIMDGIACADAAPGVSGSSNTLGSNGCYTCGNCASF